MTATLHELDLTRTDWTVDEVANLPEDLYYELIEGRLVVSPLPMPIHTEIGRYLCNALDVNRPKDRRPLGESSVMVNFRTELRPDAVVVRNTPAAVCRSPMMVADIVMVVEITSPSTHHGDRARKKRLYADSGIPAYWIIDALADRITLTQYLLGPDGAYELRLHTADRVTLDQPWRVTIDLPEWTEIRDEEFRL